MLELGARFALHLLYHGGIEAGSADSCNLFTLLQEGLGSHDDSPQVPLAEVVAHVRLQLGEAARPPTSSHDP